MKSNVTIPGKKGAIARLIVLGLISVIAVLVSFLSLPHYIGQTGFFPALLEAFGSCGLLLMLAASAWAMMKWLVVIAPKSFGLAKRFWLSWEALTFFGLYIKACIWLLIAVTPCAVATMFVSPLVSLGLLFAENMNLLTALGMLLGGGLLVVLVGFVDICKLGHFSPIRFVKGLWQRNKVAKQ